MNLPARSRSRVRALFVRLAGYVHCGLHLQTADGVRRRGSDGVCMPTRFCKASALPWSDGFFRLGSWSFRIWITYFDHIIEMSVDPDGKPGLLNYEINLSLSQNPTSPKSSCETTEQATLTSES